MKSHDKRNCPCSAEWGSHILFWQFHLCLTFTFNLMFLCSTTWAHWWLYMGQSCPILNCQTWFFRNKVLRQSCQENYCLPIDQRIGMKDENRKHETYLEKNPKLVVVNVKGRLCSVSWVSWLSEILYGQHWRSLGQMQSRKRTVSTSK